MAPKDSEDIPLLPTDKSSVKQIRPETAIPVDFEEPEEVTFRQLSRKDKRRHITLWASDAALIVIDYFQYFALILAISENWPWPYYWIYYARFLFLLNLDIWEFTKLQSNAYKPDEPRNFDSYSTEVGIDYRFYLFGWIGGLAVILVCFIAGYIYIRKKSSKIMLIQISQLKRVFMIIAQILAIPVGVLIARVFHCTTKLPISGSYVSVYTNATCYSGEHWIMIAPSIFVACIYFIAFPIWLILTIRAQLFSPIQSRHEGYLQLKETEYVQGLDTIWAVGQFHIFSSFTRRWAYYRPVLFFLKFVILICYAGLQWTKAVQAGCIMSIIILLLIAMIFVRPFRLRSFNVYVIFTLVCEICNVLLGFMLSVGTQSVFLRLNYLSVEIGIINGTWLGVTIVWLIWLILRHYRIIMPRKSLWPYMLKSKHGDDNDDDAIDETTKKYMRAVLTGRQVLEEVLSAPAIFAPVHEISRQIKIINAYGREAEMLKDSVFDSLWDLLDELIEAHNMLAPKSLFNESHKSTIRETAQEFMRIMPAFKHRLEQRQYDFVLMSPQKRRLLLKMYIIGIFVNGRSEKMRRQKEEAKKIWHEPELDIDEDSLASDDNTELDGYDDLESRHLHHENNDQHNSGTLDTIDRALAGDNDDTDDFMRDIDEWTNAHRFLLRSTGKNRAPSAISRQSLSAIVEESKPSSDQKLTEPMFEKQSTNLIDLDKNDHYPNNTSETIEVVIEKTRTTPPSDIDNMTERDSSSMEQNQQSDISQPIDTVEKDESKSEITDTITLPSNLSESGSNTTEEHDANIDKSIEETRSDTTRESDFTTEMSDQINQPTVNEQQVTD